MNFKKQKELLTEAINSGCIATTAAQFAQFLKIHARPAS